MSKCPNCGFPLTEHSKARSLPDHRRFFGLIRATLHHWNEMNDFQPDNEEHLRKWLLCKAGYRDVTMIPCEFAEDQPGVLKLAMLAVEAALKASGTYSFVRPHGAGLAVFSAKSIAWDKLSQHEFHEIRDAVTAVIEDQTGMKADVILKNTEEAA